MLTVKKAHDIVKPMFPKQMLTDCVDIGNAFAFYFSNSKEPIPGIPYVIVNKKTKRIDYLTIPPLENLHLIQNGKHLDIKQFNN